MSQSSLIEEVTKASAVFFKKTLKYYTAQDMLKNIHQRNKNLYEMCFQYPTKGVGFKVWRKTWPKDSYYIVHEVKIKNLSHGKIFGTKFWKGKQADHAPIRIRGGTKRGLWRYDIHNSTIKFNNGLVYTPEDMKEYKPLSTTNYKYGKYE